MFTTWTMTRRDSPQLKKEGGEGCCRSGSCPVVNTTDHAANDSSMEAPSSEQGKLRHAETIHHRNDTNVYFSRRRTPDAKPYRRPTDGQRKQHRLARTPGDHVRPRPRCGLLSHSLANLYGMLTDVDSLASVVLVCPECSINTFAHSKTIRL